MTHPILVAAMLFAVTGSDSTGTTGSDSSSSSSTGSDSSSSSSTGTTGSSTTGSTGSTSGTTGSASCTELTVDGGVLFDQTYSAFYTDSVTPNIGATVTELDAYFGADDAGTFAFGVAPNDNNSTCVQCFTVFNDWADGGGRVFFATAGNVVVNSVDSSAGNLDATLSNVTLTEVTIDSNTGASTPVVGGACVHIAGAVLQATAPVAPPGWNCPAEYYGTDDGCDCGCGIADPDCTDATEASCDWCYADTCGTDGQGADECATSINATDNSQCAAGGTTTTSGTAGSNGGNSNGGSSNGAGSTTGNTTASLTTGTNGTGGTSAGSTSGTAGSTSTTTTSGTGGTTSQANTGSTSGSSGSTGSSGSSGGCVSGFGDASAALAALGLVIALRKKRS